MATSRELHVALASLEHVAFHVAFVFASSEEYDPLTDQGVHLNFWDGRRVARTPKRV